MRRLLFPCGAILLALVPARAEQGQPVAAVPVVEWTRFVDPNEGAFSLDVPQGWKNAGGTVRRNALQVWLYETSVSPDGDTLMTINDPNSVSYVIPTPLLAAGGFVEGSLYGGGGGTQYVVARYKSGAEFAVSYGLQALPRLCAAAHSTRSTPRQDTGREINALYRPYGMTVDAGEAVFTCRKGAMAMQAYIFVAITAIHGQFGAIWYPSLILGFLTPERFSAPVAGLLGHMIGSVEMNAQWVSRQGETNMAVSRIASRSNAAVSNAIMRSWEQHGAALDKIMDEGSRTRLGIDYYANASGQQFTVENTHQYYWINDAGKVVGTETDTAPGADFSRMRRVSP
ncbi:MAG: hypothetical protein JO010_11525 [Alphaproteobacteria bacterium]|nr:hypothetical protein [Alphaproteobacteria bacterium]